MKIFGYKYKVDRSKSSHEMGAMGRFSAESLTIQISSSLAEQQQESTMLHEILEAVLYHLEIKMDHEVISSLETGLYQVLVDNGVDLSPLRKVK